MSDDVILRDYMRIAGERTALEITQSILAEYGISSANSEETHDTQATTGQLTEDDIPAAFAALPDEPRAQVGYKPRFEHVYNADGTCHAFNCDAPGLILAYDEFSPEIAQWFCGMHWSDCTGKELLTVAEDLRKPIAAFFGGTYEVRESSPGVFTHTWDMAVPVQALYDKIREGAITGASFSVPPGVCRHSHTGRLWRRYQRAVARRARYVRLHQRARARYRRHDRAVFRRRKRGIA